MDFFVKNGGNLILTCRTAQKDRYGRLPEVPFGSMITPLTGNEMNFYDLLLPKSGFVSVAQCSRSFQD